MKANNENFENNRLDLLIGKLQKEDSTYAAIIKAIQIMYWILIPAFTFMTVREYMDGKNLYELTGGICYVSAFLIIALFFRKYYKEYKYVDYSLPTVQMLKKAVWRYQVFQKKTLWVFVGFILMDIGATFDWMNEFPVWATQAIYLGGLSVGFIVGVIIWYIKYKPLRDDALRLIREIEG